MQLHLEDEAVAEPRGSASTSRGSLLTLHCEEAAAEEEAAPSPAPAQSPAATEWPPASPQDPPPRLRRAAHRARRAQHGQLRQPHAAVRNSSGGRGAAPFVSTAARSAPGGAAATRERTAEHEGDAQSFGAGAPFARGGPQDCRGRQGEVNAHPFRSGAPFFPHPHASRSTLAAQLLPLPLPPPPPPKLAPPLLPPWLGAVT